MNNGRDCAHGRQVGKCDTCDLIEAEKEIEALKSQVETLRKAIIWYDDCDSASQTRYALLGMLDAAKATPAQCLAEIQADAYWKGYVAGGDDFRSRIDIPLEVVTKKANELIVKLYPESESAKKISQQAKGSE